MNKFIFPAFTLVCFVCLSFALTSCGEGGSTSSSKTYYDDLDDGNKKKKKKKKKRNVQTYNLPSVRLNQKNVKEELSHLELLEQVGTELSIQS